MILKTLYYGGDIVTMTGKEVYPEALLVSDGRISYIGNKVQAESIGGEEIKAVDLHGKTLFPAFIDGHGHISVAAQMVQAADLSECTSYSEIIGTLKEFMNENKVSENEVLVGFGYDHNFLKEAGHPAKDVLDQVSKEIPIYISHISGHMGCANSAAIRAAGIDSSTPNPDGGIIGRTDGSSEPNGYFEEAGMIEMQKFLTDRVHVDMDKGLEKAQHIYLKYGVTTVQDGASGSGAVRLMKEACEKGAVKLDVVSYPVIGEEDPSEIFKEYPASCEQYNQHFKLGGYKAILDGSPQGKSAWLTSPYENSGEYCGYPWVSDETAEGFMIKALRDKKQILVHCNGDAAGDQYLKAYSKALEKVPEAKDLDLRPVMIHCQTVRDDQLNQMKALGMIPSIFIGHVYYWGDVHLKNLGEKRGSRISPCKSAFDRGLAVNFHQDTPVTKPDMLHSVWTAVNRMTRDGKLLGAEQRIGVYNALKAVTINAAYAYHEEKIKGTLETGKLADLIILEKNPLKADKMELKDIRVLETIKEGKTLYKLSL